MVRRAHEGSGAMGATEPLADRKADRTHVLNLTGSMQGYRWSFNNVPWTKDIPPLMVAEGERVELAVTNQTMMPHLPSTMIPIAINKLGRSH